LTSLTVSIVHSRSHSTIDGSPPTMIAPSTRSRSAYLSGLGFSVPKLPGSRIAFVSSLFHLIAYVPSATPDLSLKPKYVTNSPLLRMIPASLVFDESVAERSPSATFTVVEPYVDSPISTSSNALLSYITPADIPRTPSVSVSSPQALDTVAST